MGTGMKKSTVEGHSKGLPATVSGVIVADKPASESERCFPNATLDAQKSMLSAPAG